MYTIWGYLADLLYKALLISIGKVFTNIYLNINNGILPLKFNVYVYPNGIKIIQPRVVPPRGKLPWVRVAKSRSYPERVESVPYVTLVKFDSVASQVTIL